MDNFNELFDSLIDMGFFTEDELVLVTNINGSTIDTLNDCIYARYGYRSFEQMVDANYD